MMSYTYWTGTPSVWIAILYLFLGLPLLLNPVASGTFFIWALAAGSAVYAVSHLARYIQERKEGLASGGDLFLTVVPLLFTIASLIWPQTVLAFLPLVLGLSDGATEKHLPAIYQVGDQVEIAVGIQTHPMTEEHFIDWVILETDTGFHVADLAAGQAPHASFRLAPMEQVAGAYAFCNLHGLWLTDASTGFGL